MNSLKIYSITHKNYIYPKSQWISQLAVGDFADNCECISEKIGQSITDKNPSYNEITAQYWVRHNAPTSFVGFCHYRRYFLFTTNNLSNSPEFYSSDSSIFDTLSHIDEYNKCKNIFNFADIILPRATYFPNGLKRHYIDNGIPEETWQVFSFFCAKLFPESLKYISYLEESNYAHMRNMYIMSWDLFCVYFDKLISILDAVYSEIGGPKYSNPSQNRYPGFLAEHFLNLWIQTKSIRKFEVPIINLDFN